MCGLAGVARQRPRGVSAELLERMAAAIRHRGPDGFGLYADDRIGLAHVRLSVIDVAGGAQPMTNEDGDVRVVYNGEIYNYLELRHELEVRGHVFRTRSDTEVLVHGYEKWSERSTPRAWTRCSPSGRRGRRAPHSAASGRSSRGAGRGGGRERCRSGGTMRSTTRARPPSRRTPCRRSTTCCIRACGCACGPTCQWV